MLLEDGETRTRGCKNLEIKNFMYPTLEAGQKTPEIFVCESSNEK